MITDLVWGFHSGTTLNFAKMHALISTNSTDMVRSKGCRLSEIAHFPVATNMYLAGLQHQYIIET